MGGGREFAPLPPFPKRYVEGRAGEQERGRGPPTHTLGGTDVQEVIGCCWSQAHNLTCFWRRFFQIKPFGWWLGSRRRLWSQGCRRRGRKTYYFWGKDKSQRWH